MTDYMRHIIRPGEPSELGMYAQNSTRTLGARETILPHPFMRRSALTTPTNTRAKHFTLVVQKHSSIIVEPDESAIWPADGFPRADDDSAANAPLAHFCCRRRGLACYRTCSFYDTDDLVADGAPAVVDLLLEDVDTLDEEGA